MSVVPPGPKLDRSHIAPVTTREELIYLLTRACELEHGLACVYLFAAHSLKSDASEGGLTPEQTQMVRRWKRKLACVAVEEMLHLAQVCNMLTAIGGAPHFRRENFPRPATAFPFGIELSLEPFTPNTARRLVCYEMPEVGILPPERQSVYDQLLAQVAKAIERPSQVGSARCLVEPFDVDFKTVGEFYHKIGTGFQCIPQDVLFIGPPEAQANARYVDLDGELIPVVDCASALDAIEMIVQQGEAPTSDHPDAHFCVFDGIRVEYEAAIEQARQTGVPFEPVRPVVANPMTRYYEDTSAGSLITDELTHAVAQLYNVAYDTMLLMLLRFFAHTEESDDELKTLSRATLRIMASALRPLGEALTKMPVGPDLPGKTAGPGFGFYRDVHLLPHKQSAWIFFAERLDQLASKAMHISTHDRAPLEIAEAAAVLQEAAMTISTYTPRALSEAADAQTFSQSEGVTIAPEPNGPYLVSNVTRMTNSKGETLTCHSEMALCRCGNSLRKPYCDGSHAWKGFTSEKSVERTPDRRDVYVGSAITIFDNRGTCCHSGNCSDHLPSVFKQGAEPWIDPDGASVKEIIDIVRTCPSGALSYMVDGIEYRDQERPPGIYVSQDGPYHIQGRIELLHEPRNAGASSEHFALCRCGQSKNKPFCDGSHWYAGFKDPNN